MKCEYCGETEFIEQRNEKGEFVEMYCVYCDKKSEYHTNKILKGIKKYE